MTPVKPDSRLRGMDNRTLIGELDTMLRYTPLTEESKKLIMELASRLGLADRAKDSLKPHMSGIDLTKVRPDKDSYGLKSAINDWVNAAFAFITWDPELRNKETITALNELNKNVSADAFQTAQLYIEIHRMGDGIMWRMFVDTPHRFTKEMLVRQLISKETHYAFPVEFINKNPDILPTVYNLQPPAWGQEVFTEVLVDFDEGKITHRFRIPSTEDGGVYVCDMTGVVLDAQTWTGWEP